MKCRYAILIGLTTLGLLASMPELTLDAQDVQNRKPLPSFLRSAAIADRYLSTRDVDELLQFELVEPVCIQLIKRYGVPLHVRAEALAKLAQLRDSDGATELVPWIEHWDQQSDDETSSEQRSNVLQQLGQLLPQQARAGLEQQRDRLTLLARQGKHAATRQAAYAGLIQAGAAADEAWSLAEENASGLQDLLRGLSWLPSEAPREALYQKARPLLREDVDTELRRVAIESIGTLNVRPREVFATLAELVANDTLTDACVPSLSKISNEYWTEDLRAPLADGLLRYLNRTPPRDRTSPRAKQTIKLIRAIADRMPPEDAARVMRDLEAAAIKEILIRTVEEQMKYDQTVLVVSAGQGLQITLENDDIMPHNLVIVDSPEAREDVGIAADQMQNEPDALARGYLPDSPQILHATKLLYPKQSERLTLTAPTEPGVYAYLCTFPGHWSKMYGALVVAEDAATYLAEHQPLPTADEILGIRTVDWTFEQLSGELARIGEGRDFANGARMFLKASCFACHQIGEQGGRIGPELTKIAEKHKTPSELLRHVMLPSEKVEEQYATVIVETTDGLVLRGVLVDETDNEIRITENPLASCEPIVVSKSDVEDLSRSQLSPMPEQLLNTITDTDDVLDLLAYVFAGGDQAHPLFK